MNRPLGLLAVFAALSVTACGGDKPVGPDYRTGFDLLFTDGEAFVVVGGVCTETKCTITTKADTDPEVRLQIERTQEAILDHDFDDPSTIVDPEFVIGTRRGATWYRTEHDEPEYGTRGGLYGAWMKDSVFAVTFEEAEDARLYAALATGRDVYASSPTGVRGGAVWTGSMVGADTRTGDFFDGIATVDIDRFSDPDVDVVFTGMGRPSLSWMDMPLEDGGYMSRTDDSFLQGRFYGTDRAETAGVFTHEDIVGAFGASKP